MSSLISLVSGLQGRSAYNKISESRAIHAEAIGGVIGKNESRVKIKAAFPRSHPNLSTICLHQSGHIC